MTSLTDLCEVVDVVIGVDTHVHTHSAAVVDTATGGVLDEITIEATPICPVLGERDGPPENASLQLGDGIGLVTALGIQHRATWLSGRVSSPTTVRS